MTKKKKTSWDIIPKKPMIKLPKKGSFREVGFEYGWRKSYHKLLKKKKDLYPKSYFEHKRRYKT